MITIFQKISVIDTNSNITIFDCYIIKQGDFNAGGIIPKERHSLDIKSQICPFFDVMAKAVELSRKEQLNILISL